MADEEITLPRGVKDVPAELFIKAYAQHLKQNDKVQGYKSSRPCMLWCLMGGEAL